MNVISYLTEMLTGQPASPPPSAGGVLNAAGMQGPVGSPSGSAPNIEDGSMPWSMGRTPIAKFMGENAGVLDQAAKFRGAAERAMAPPAPPASGPAPANAALEAPPAALPQVPGIETGAPPQAGGGAVDILAMLDEATRRADPANQQPAPGGPEVLPWKQPGAMPPAAPAPTEEASGVTTKGVQDFIRDVSAAGSGNTNSKFGAFMTGSSRAIESGIKHKKEEDAASLAAEDRSFKRDLDTSQEERAVRKDARDARSDTIRNAKVLAEVKKLSDGSLTAAQMIQLEGQANNLVQQLMKNDSTLTLDEAVAKLPALLKSKQDRIMGGVGATPAAGAAATPGAAQGEGQTATNPKTGEKVILKGGKWVPVQ